MAAPLSASLRRDLGTIESYATLLGMLLGADRSERDSRLPRAGAGHSGYLRRLLGLPLHAPRPRAGRRVHPSLANLRRLRPGVYRRLAQGHLVHWRAGLSVTGAGRLR